MFSIFTISSLEDKFLKMYILIQYLVRLNLVRSSFSVLTIFASLCWLHHQQLHNKWDCLPCLEMLQSRIEGSPIHFSFNNFVVFIFIQSHFTMECYATARPLLREHTNFQFFLQPCYCLKSPLSLLLQGVVLFFYFSRFMHVY